MTKITVAAFDFDGTLTYRDTLIPFLLFVCGPSRVIQAIFLSIPQFIGYLFKYYDRQDVKEALLTRTIAGMSFQDVSEKGKEFAKGPLMKLLRPEAMARVDWHRERGDQLVLVSANLDLYLKPWGAQQGFNEVVCSQVAKDQNGFLTGRLIGKNCRAQEKVVRLNQLYVERDDYTVYAYGDSAGDKEMLEWADYPFYRRFE